nr:hypothetical protein A5881_003778 [Enterococcus termitis]OTP46809.1 hypothetical protein A5881_003787 [Enterococcus termitis]
MKTGLYVLYLHEYKGYFVKLDYQSDKNADGDCGYFVGTVKRDQSKILGVCPKVYKTRSGAKKGISTITRNHFYTKENDVEITELTTSDIDVMGLYDLVV